MHMTRRLLALARPIISCLETQLTQNIRRYVDVADTVYSLVVFDHYAYPEQIPRKTGTKALENIITGGTFRKRNKFAVTPVRNRELTLYTPGQIARVCIT